MDESKFYHERQRLQLCALHSLNNLFQKRIFAKKDLDEIVREFDSSIFFNEYSSLFTGNYDLSIILEALKRQNYTLLAITKENPLTEADFDDCFGILLNIPVKGLVLHRIPIINERVKPGRHWLILKSIDGQTFYDFDSNHRNPERIGSRTDLIEYLKKKQETDSYIYKVVSLETVT